MIEIYVAVAVASMAAGALIGVLAVVALGIHISERAFSRGRTDAESCVASGTRWLTGALPASSMPRGVGR